MIPTINVLATPLTHRYKDLFKLAKVIIVSTLYACRDLGCEVTLARTKVFRNLRTSQTIFRSKSQGWRKFEKCCFHPTVPAVVYSPTIELNITVILSSMSPTKCAGRTSKNNQLCTILKLVTKLTLCSIVMKAKIQHKHNFLIGYIFNVYE